MEIKIMGSEVRQDCAKIPGQLCTTSLNSAKLFKLSKP